MNTPPLKNKKQKQNKKQCQQQNHKIIWPPLLICFLRHRYVGMFFTYCVFCLFLILCQCTIMKSLTEDIFLVNIIIPIAKAPAKLISSLLYSEAMEIYIDLKNIYHLQLFYI